MLELAYIAVALAGLAYASYTDITKGIVPNRLSIAMLAAGVALHAADSITTSNPNYIIQSLGGAALAFAVGFLLWKLGAWAGGDVKLFAGIGALLPNAPTAGLWPFYYSLPLFPFLVAINSVIISFPFVMLFVFFRAATRAELRKELLKAGARLLDKSLVLTGVAIGYLWLAGLLGLPAWLVILPLLLVPLLPPVARHVLAAIASLPGAFNVPLSLATLAAFLVFAGIFEAIAFGRTALRKKVRTGDLAEGMIPAQTLYADGGRVKAWAYSLTAPMKEPRGVIVSERRAAGMTKAEIARLRKLGVREVWVKEGVPLVPIVFIGAATAVFVGDLLTIIINLF
jgi:preflagellin peptidase FlaK